MITRSTASRIVELAAFAAFGCAQDIPEPRPSRHSDSVGQAAPLTSSVAKYQHEFSRSRFVAGAAAQARVESGFQKVVGEFGVFATDGHNGAVTAIPHGASGRELAEPFTDDEGVHNKAVLDYFLGAGIPPAQVGSASVTTVIEGTGTLVDGRDAPPRFVAFNTVLERRVSGVQVADSFAWARLAKDGSVVSEGVYWPELDSNVINDAIQLDQTLSNPSVKVGLIAHAKAVLPDLDETSLHAVVHHSPYWYPGAFRSYAVLDAIVGTAGRKPLTVHLAAGGVPVVLDHENLASAPVGATKKP
ncbi:MAG: hypothetical protein IPI67_20270 [Myxococcales bacterium]|nr:hypothetical protein [Myxococcales bacterium]